MADQITSSAATPARIGTTAVGALAGFGLGMTALRLWKAHRSPRTEEREATDRRAAFHDYLRDHLTGSDAALSVVERLRHSHRGTPEGTLCERLSREFREERVVVRTMLTELGGTVLSLKRVVGQASGAVLQGVAGGEPGDLALFRTLEGLAVGVQGKRCLWRAAQTLTPTLRAPGAKSFRDLEQQAVEQWEQIEACRQALAPRTFA